MKMEQNDKTLNRKIDFSLFIIIQIIRVHRVYIALSGGRANIGIGKDLTIRELAETFHRIVYADMLGRACIIEWDASRPNDMPLKLPDVSQLRAIGRQARANRERLGEYEVGFTRYCPVFCDLL
jgi:hypothetical protein